MIAVERPTVLPWTLPLRAVEDPDGTWYVRAADGALVETGLDCASAERLVSVCNEVEGLIDDARAAVRAWEASCAHRQRHRWPVLRFLDLVRPECPVTSSLGRLSGRLDAIP